jgi:hypothetical protein
LGNLRIAIVDKNISLKGKWRSFAIVEAHNYLILTHFEDNLATEFSHMELMFMSV